MALDLRLQHKLSQQLVMTPQLQQAIKLLQLSHLEMAQALQQELLENPVLEEQELSLRQRERDRRAASGRGEGQEGTGALAAAPTTLAEHLRWQLSMGSCAPPERQVAFYLVEELDEDGYLPANVVPRVAAALELAETVVQRALGALQLCDPVGVGARSLQECLLLQARQPVDEATAPYAPLMVPILEHHLAHLQARKLGPIARALKVAPDEVLAAVRALGALEPRPGRNFAATANFAIVPDLFVTRSGPDEDAFAVAINEEGLPRLCISPHYRGNRSLAFEGETRTYVQEKLRAASWLLRSIHMRQRTMVRVMQSILKFQRPFFLQGTQALVPLVLRDVALDVGLHESTVSRVTSNKFVHTPHGLFELKFFFNSTIVGTKGDRLASQSVRERIQQVIAKENKNEPLSDQKIVELLRRQDIQIARRTVAKYRKMLGRQPANSRRREF